jgi:hypothetical protein
MTAGAPQSRHENQPILLCSGDDPAGGMILKRHALALLVLGCGLLLAACSNFAGTVSDAWPHWAGGEPAGTPPRPGSPGYQEFVAHRQAATGADQQQPPSATGTTAPQPAPTAAATPPARAPNQPLPQAPAQDTAVARGGLY